MDWLTRLTDLVSLRAHVSSERKSLVLLNKVNTLELEECVPKGIIRERSFWRIERIDFYHLQPDGSIKHTPGD